MRIDKATIQIEKLWDIDKGVRPFLFMGIAGTIYIFKLSDDMFDNIVKDSPPLIDLNALAKEKS